MPGSAVGGLLAVYAPAGAVKRLLGCVLLGSVPGVFRGRIPRQ